MKGTLDYKKETGWVIRYKPSLIGILPADNKEKIIPLHPNYVDVRWDEKTIGMSVEFEKTDIMVNVKDGVTIETVGKITKIEESTPDLSAEEKNNKITRLEVIDETGRAYVKYFDGSLELSYQDEGRTLKIFIRTSQLKKQ